MHWNLWRFLDPNLNDLNSRAKLASHLRCWESLLEWESDIYRYIPIYTIAHCGRECTFQISSQIYSTISAGWSLQKEGYNNNEAEILRNLNHCLCPALEGMQKRHSIDVSAPHLGKRRTLHWFSELRRIPSIPKVTVAILRGLLKNWKSCNQQLQKSGWMALCISNINFQCILKHRGSSREGNLLAGSQ